MKNTLKKIVVVCVSLLLVIVTFTNVYAVNPKGYVDNATINDTANGNIKTAGKNIVGFIQVAGSIASAAVLLVMGIKYMTGSTEEKAEYKKSFIPYFVGAILVFAGVNVAKVIYNFASGF